MQDEVQTYVMDDSSLTETENTKVSELAKAIEKKMLEQPQHPPLPVRKQFSYEQKKVSSPVFTSVASKSTSSIQTNQRGSIRFNGPPLVPGKANEEYWRMTMNDSISELHKTQPNSKPSIFPLKLTKSTPTRSQIPNFESDKNLRLISRKPSTHISTEDIVEFFQELDGSISKSKLRKFLDKTMDTAEFCNQITNLTGQTMLHVLASKGDVEKLIWFLSYKHVQDSIDFNVRDPQGLTALHIAAMEKRLEMIEYLLQFDRIDVNAQAISGNIPLHYLVRHPYTDEKEMTTVLRIVKTMVKLGANIDACNEGDETPLFHACLKGGPSAVTMLLELGANFNARNKMQETVLHYAVRRGNMHIVALLVNRKPHPDIHAAGEQGTAMEVAKSEQKWEILALLNGVYNKEKKSAFLMLGNKLVHRILGFLEPKSILKVASTCQVLRLLCTDDMFWCFMYKSQFREGAFKFQVEPRGKWREEFKLFYIANKQFIFRKKLEKKIKLDMKLFVHKIYPMRKIHFIHLAAKRWRSKREYERRLRLYQQRTNVAKELLETENSYFAGLTIIVKHYMASLLEVTNSNKPWITLQEVEKIFSEIETILSVNKILLKKLQSRLDRWEPSQKIGDIFIENAPNLKLYAGYVSNYHRSLATIDKCLRNRDFEHWLHERESTHRNHTLDSVLILPVQRIPRYCLLLEQLLKYTWEEHCDYEDLTEAVHVMRETAAYVNERKREEDDKVKVMELQKEFRGIFTQQHISADRVLLFEGECNLHTSKIESKSMHLFLFHDIFVLCKRKKRGQYKVVAMETLVELLVSNISFQHEFGVAPGVGFILVSKDKETVISTKTAEEATIWIDNFQNAILREHEAKERRERALQAVNNKLKLEARAQKIATNEVVSGISQVSHEISNQERPIGATELQTILTSWTASIMEQVSQQIRTEMDRFKTEIVQDVVAELQKGAVNTRPRRKSATFDRALFAARSIVPVEVTTRPRTKSDARDVQSVYLEELTKTLNKSQ